MNQEQFIERLKEWKQEFYNEVIVIFRGGDNERGQLAFRRWESRFTSFLKERLPKEATNYTLHMMKFGAVGRFGEHPLHSFLRNDGNKVIAFIEDLINEVSKGYINLEAQPLPEKNSLVDFLLTEPQKLWLEAILNKQKKGEDIDERIIKIELLKELPKEFDPSEIDSRLLRGKTNITLFGIGLLEPESEIVEKTNKVIQGVQGILENSPKTEKITAKEISNSIRISEGDVENIFEKLANIGLFHNSGINGLVGWSAININDRIDGNAFDNYLKHETIAQWLDEIANEESKTPTQQATSETTQNMQEQPDSKKVFLVHGRNKKANRAMFTFLRSIGLQPLEWSEAVDETGKASPYVGEVLDKAFSVAQAIVVLMTPDDVAMLQEPFRNPDDEQYETELTPQARPNVLFEAGMAMGRNPDRTVLVELGKLRPFSDIGGRYTIRLENSTAARQYLAQRLQTAGCAVNLLGTHWHDEGDFELSIESVNNEIQN